MNEITPRIEKVFRTIFKKEDLVIEHTMTSFDIPGWDSLTNMRLIIAVEKEFKVRFGASDVVNLKNVGHLIDLIERKLSPG